MIIRFCIFWGHANCTEVFFRGFIKRDLRALMKLHMLWCCFIFLLFLELYTADSWEPGQMCVHRQREILYHCCSALWKTDSFSRWKADTDGREGVSGQRLWLCHVTIMLMCYYSFHVLNLEWTCALLCVSLWGIHQGGDFSFSLHRNTVITIHLSNPSSDCSHMQLLFI